MFETLIAAVKKLDFERGLMDIATDAIRGLAYLRANRWTFAETDLKELERAAPGVLLMDVARGTWGDLELLIATSWSRRPEAGVMSVSMTEAFPRAALREVIAVAQAELGEDERP